jgi:hypothetical protein
MCSSERDGGVVDDAQTAALNDLAENGLFAVRSAGES